MSGVSGVSSSSYADYGKIASGNKLQSAADGAAELTIVEEENTQVTGYDVGSANMQSGKEVLNISDAALGSVNDQLQRIRELALEASNSVSMTDTSRQSIQEEIDQLKQGISDVASYTQYNGKNLLDGTNSEFSMATDANGNQATINTANATLEALGIADFDVTGSFDLETIDNAIAQVSASRSSMGAQSNGLDYAMNFNSNASYNLTGAQSRLEDLDIPKAVSEQKKKETLQQYSLMMQKKQQENEANRMKGFFS